MAGATLALAISKLTQGQLPVNLIEGTVPGDQSHPGFDGRSIALAAGTCQQLQNIGVWSALAPLASAITDIHVSDQGHLGQVQLSHESYRLPALGNVIELHAAGKVLFSMLKDAPGITLYCPQKVAKLERDPQQVTVTLENGHTLQGDMIVIANGTRSPLATQAGFAWRTAPYDQVAVIANIETDQPHQGRAFERFTPYGPLALLPMSNNRLSLVWCRPAAESEQLMSLADDEFLQQLQQAFGWRLGKFIRVGRRESYPLALQQAERLVTHRSVVIGNAAQTLHPIAGQGFNLGLRDVMSLAETLCTAFKLQQDVGSYNVLNHYQQRRLADRTATIGVTDGLVRLFANDNRPLIVGRNLGLVAMDHLPWFKHLLAGRTLGWVKR